MRYTNPRLLYFTLPNMVSINKGECISDWIHPLCVLVLCMWEWCSFVSPCSVFYCVCMHMCVCEINFHYSNTGHLFVGLYSNTGHLFVGLLGWCCLLAVCAGLVDSEASQCYGAVGSEDFRLDKVSQSLAAWQLLVFELFAAAQCLERVDLLNYHHY